MSITTMNKHVMERWERKRIVEVRVPERGGIGDVMAVRNRPI